MPVVGSTKYPGVVCKMHLFPWMEHILALLAQHIADENVQADISAVSLLDPSEWELAPWVLNCIMKHWGPPAMDLMMAASHAKAPYFFSCQKTAGAKGVDAFIQLWLLAHLLYVFPPWPLILHLCRIESHPCLVILLAPRFNRSACVMWILVIVSPFSLGCQACFGRAQFSWKTRLLSHLWLGP